MTPREQQGQVQGGSELVGRPAGFGTGFVRDRNDSRTELHKIIQLESDTTSRIHVLWLEVSCCIVDSGGRDGTGGG